MDNFKVGDYVTPDPDTFDNTYTSLTMEIGNVFKVININHYPNGDYDTDFDLDRNVGDSDHANWVCKHWKLAKNYMVKSIIDDL